MLIVRYNGNARFVAACGMVRDAVDGCVYPDKLIRIRVDPAQAIPEYVELAMLTPDARRQLDPFIKTAAGQHGISGKDLRRLIIALPPLAEQRRIVARIEVLFVRTRRARADLERIAALSAKHRRAILAREHKGEHAASADQHRLVPLSECVHDFTYGTAVRCSRDLEGTPVLRIPNVAAGRVALDDMKFAVLPKREQQKLALAIGDILIVRSNGSPELVGRPALVERPAAGMAFAGYLIRARPRLDRVEPAYLLHMLSSPSVRKTIELNARSSSGVHNINAAELAALRVPLPSLSEQQQAVRRIEQAMGHALVWEAEATRALALLDHLEQSILSRAFRGELVPQTAAESADALAPTAQGEDAPVARRGRMRAAAG